MATNKTKIKIASSIVAAATALAASFLTDHEGTKYTAYPDVVGKYTICNGLTIGVKKGDVYTPEQCKTVLVQYTSEFMMHVISELDIPPVFGSCSKQRTTCSAR